MLCAYFILAPQNGGYVEDFLPELRRWPQRSRASLPSCRSAALTEHVPSLMQSAPCPPRQQPQTEPQYRTQSHTTTTAAAADRGVRWKTETKASKHSISAVKLINRCIANTKSLQSTLQNGCLLSSTSSSPSPKGSDSHPCNSHYVMGVIIYSIFTSVPQIFAH